jgi:hypothetical protein
MIDSFRIAPRTPHPHPLYYIGGWGVEGCKRPAGDARSVHARTVIVLQIIDSDIQTETFYSIKAGSFFNKKGITFFNKKVFKPHF